MIEYNNQLTILFEIWKNKRGYSEYTFVNDGLMRSQENVDELWHKSKRKIAFLMKDKSDGSCDDVRDWLKDNDNQNNQMNRRMGNTLFRNIGNILYGLYHDECDYNNVVDNEQVVVDLLSVPFAYIECKKEAGHGNLKSSVLQEYLRNDRDFLQMELAILNPNMIVCSGWPINIFVKEMYSQEELYVMSNNLSYHPQSNTVILLGYHPTAWSIPQKGHFYGVMSHYEKFLQTDYGHQFLDRL